jgi:DNA-binding transcriptional MerR regulator
MFKIGEFSKFSQVTVKTLRYYDQIGLLKPAEVDRFTGYRYYSVDQLPRLNRILALKDLGLSLTGANRPFAGRRTLG